MDGLFKKLKDLYETNKSVVLVEHNPMSQRYRRAERRLFRLVSAGKPIACGSWQKVTVVSDKKVNFINLVIWLEPDEQFDEEYGHYVVFDLFFSSDNETLLSATLFCYYDGQDNSSTKLKNEHDAIAFAKQTYQ